MKYFIRILLTPSCWIRNYPSGAKISQFIRERLAKGEKPKLNWLGDIELGGKVFWGSNYPYAYGNLVNGAKAEGCLPDRKTVFMLHDAVESAYFSDDQFDQE